MPIDTSHERNPESVSLRDYIDERINGLNTVSSQRHELAEEGLHRMEESRKEVITRIDQSINGVITLMEAKFNAVEKATLLLTSKTESQFFAVANTQLLAKDALQSQFDSISKSTETASAAMDKRLEGMNEFRQQMNEWAGKFITRADVENTIKYMGDRVSAMEVGMSTRITRDEMGVQQGAMGERVSSLEKFSNNMQGRMWVIAAVVVIMEIALRFLAH